MDKELIHNHIPTKSEYDQEIPHSNTADQSTGLGRRATVYN